MERNLGDREAIEIETHPVLRKNLSRCECNEYLINGAPCTLRRPASGSAGPHGFQGVQSMARAVSWMKLTPLLREGPEAGIITPDEAKYYIARLLLNDPITTS